jgi:hypothetical protein
MEMNRRVALLVGVVVGLLGLVALSGCMSGPSVSYSVGVSEPYDVSSGVIEMRFNASAQVQVNNSGGGELRFWVDSATITAVFEDGSSESVSAQPVRGVVPADGVGNLSIEFEGVPARFVMADSPPRMHSMISHYDVNVTSRGQQKVLFFWSPEKTERKDMRIPMDDIPFGDYVDAFRRSLRF